MQTILVRRKSTGTSCPPVPLGGDRHSEIIPILVHWCCCNKAPWTGGGYAAHTTLWCSQVWRQRSEVREALHSSGRASSRHRPLAVSPGGRGLRSLWSLFSGHGSLSQALHPHDLVTSQTPHLQIPPHWRWDFNKEFWREHSQSIALYPSTYMILLKRQKQGQKTDQCLPGAGGWERSW